MQAFASRLGLRGKVPLSEIGVAQDRIREARRDGALFCRLVLKSAFPPNIALHQPSSFRTIVRAGQ